MTTNIYSTCCFTARKLNANKYTDVFFPSVATIVPAVSAKKSTQMTKLKLLQGGPVELIFRHMTLRPKKISCLTCSLCSSELPDEASIFGYSLLLDYYLINY